MESLHLLIILWAVLPVTYSLSSLKEIRGQKGGSVWIPCYYDVKYRNSGKLFFYKNIFGRHILAQTESILTTGAADRITIHDDKSLGIFTITMKRLKKSDEGYYYCGLKREKEIEEFDLFLSVNAGDYGLSINSNRNVFTGQEKGSLAVSCKYTRAKYVSFIKYWCRGRDFDSCQELKRSDSPRHYNKRVSIRDNATSQEFTVTMTGLQSTDSDWYWCAIEKAHSHERVPAYIRVMQASETELQIDTSTSLQSTATNVMSRNQSVKSTNNTEHQSETAGTHSVAEDSRAHLTIALVIGSLLLLFLAAGVFTLRMKRNRRVENQNEKRAMQPQGEGPTEVDTEPPSEDMQYAVILFHRKTKDDTKPSRDPEDSVTYSAIGIKGTPDTYMSEN
ncbi:polymeric immunoglobulin receptor-like isoform X1 [Anguilla rostrata]|uniref:polymeric immunoglobulin receptor-like isoform X1 n=2 Tax=Anguilla rostrata TaxID=7938 RepID=UPI0030D5B573